jgi:hypothetical protein
MQAIIRTHVLHEHMFSCQAAARFGVERERIG